MFNWSAVIAKFISMCMSWIEAGNLRTRCFKMAEESEIMMTALEDIARMDHGGRMGAYAQRAIDLVRGLPDENHS
jgi:hypothetical protein